jgi:DNA-binding SARP family transcriptional activator
MEVRILGPIELLVDGRPVLLARRQQRLILGILALEANHLVSRQRLVQLLWSGSPPPHARAILQTRVSEIRSTLNSHLDGSRLLVTHDGGYLLNVEADAVDMHRFRNLLEEARRAGSDEVVRRLLRTAVQLWRGSVLGGWLPSDSHEALCAGLEEARLTANEDLWEVELKLGHHRLVADQIAPVAARNLSRERLVGLAMTALHRSGRTAEALRYFERSRRWLAAELGVDPGTELRDIHLSILDGSPRRADVPAVPRLLPFVTSHLTGRAVEVAQTCALLTSDSTSVRMVSVTGAAGVGKSALSVHAARQVPGAFPDGQLYADLRGHGRQGATDPADVLAWFLHALGVTRVPDDVDERVALYRNLLADRRVLVVLDDARDADQVRLLIPGAASCAVLVTSRARLGSAIGATSIEVGALDKPAAVELLTTLTDRSRIERDPEAAADVVDLCGRLPLAVRAVAARLNAKPHWALSELRARLADERRRLDHLAYGGLDVRASILLSCTGLPRDARNLLHRLGATGASDVDARSSAALLGLDIGEAEEILEALHDARLLEASGANAADGRHRYRLSDLVRLVAAELAVTDGPAPPVE